MAWDNKVASAHHLALFGRSVSCYVLDRIEMKLSTWKSPVQLLAEDCRTEVLALAVELKLDDIQVLLLAACPE